MTISWGRYGPAAALGLAACMLIVPLWCVQSPGMPDYPAHIAGFTLIGDALSRLWHSPDPGNVSVAIAVVLAFIGLSWIMRRWLGGSRAAQGAGAGSA